VPSRPRDDITGTLEANQSCVLTYRMIAYAPADGVNFPLTLAKGSVRKSEPSDRLMGYRCAVSNVSALSHKDMTRPEDQSDVPQWVVTAARGTRSSATTGSLTITSDRAGAMSTALSIAPITLAAVTAHRT